MRFFLPNRLRWSGLAACLLVMACASGGRDPLRKPRTAGAGPPKPVDEPAAAEPGPDAQAWREALAGVAAGAAWDSAHLFAECRRETGHLVSVEVFDSGVAVWDGRRQFELSRGAIRELLVALDAAGFADMKPVYGGRPKAPPLEEAEEGAFATQVICRVRARLDGLDKESVQLAKGEQSAALKALAQEILDRCQGPAENGVEAASLRDGLEKIASGELAPETLRLLLHRRPERAEDAERGFLLRVDGRTVSSRGFAHGAGYGEPKELSLAPAEAAELAAELAGADPGDLPVNLFAPVYTDFSLEVLNHKTTVQARQFAGMTAETHGASQGRFDRLYELLERLQERADAEGRAG